jgi:hypothetical protein
VHGHEEGVSEAISAVAASGAADFAIILEGGWTDDPLSLSLWFDGFIANGLRGLPPEKWSSLKYGF